ncbi:MAG: monooxygenase [Pseudobdellovibrionaceae bacterium]
MNLFGSMKLILAILTPVIFSLFAFNNCSGPNAANGINSQSAVDPSNGANGSNGVIVNSSKTITYSDHIGPLIKQRCFGCHQSGGVAPFTLSNYKQLNTWKSVALSDLSSRRMPPWGARDDGSCQSFQNSMWLNQSEIDLFKAWVDAGALEGASVPDISVTANNNHYDLNDPSVVEYSMPQTYVPATSGGTDEYRCFVTSEQAVDKLITGFEVIPGNTKVVHHVIAYMPATEQDEANAVSKGQGYLCTAGALVNSSVAAFWAPGTEATSYPMIQSRQTGFRIPAGRKLILQVHYNYSQGRFSDLTSVRFKTSADNVKEGVWLQFGKTGNGSIPAGLSQYEQVENMQIGQAVSGVSSNQSTPGYIYAIFPHMHQVGSKIKVELNRFASTAGSASTNECLVDVPQWDFHWQRIYWFKNPVSANALDSMKMTCTYNTTGKNQSVNFGEGSSDEMCFLFAFVTDKNI